MARLSLKKKLPGMMGSQTPATPGNPPAPLRGGMAGGGMMGRPAPAVPRPPKPTRLPVMKRKGVALSKFAPGGRPTPKRVRKPKLPKMPTM